MTFSIYPTMITFKTFIAEISENEPRATPHGTLYHAAPKEYHDSIMRQGILPNTGGSTFLNRKYSKRVYLATRIEAAWDFTMSVNARRGRDAIEYEIFHIDSSKLSKGTKFFVDSYFDHYGVWTPSKIPAAAIVDVTEVNHDWEPDDDYYGGK